MLPVTKILRDEGVTKPPVTHTRQPKLSKQASVITMLSPIVDNTTATSRHTGDYAIIARLISYAAHYLTVYLEPLLK